MWTHVNTGRSIFRTFSFNGSRAIPCLLSYRFERAVCKECGARTHKEAGFVFLQRWIVARKVLFRERKSEIGSRIAVTRCSININSSSPPRHFLQPRRRNRLISASPHPPFPSPLLLGPEPKRSLERITWATSRGPCWESGVN